MYAGWVTRHGSVLREGLHEAIVPRDLFERVLDALAKRAHSGAAERAHRCYLLSGIGICATCGRRLWANTSQNGQRYHYYRCAAPQRGELCADAPKGVRVEPIESDVARTFQHLRLPADWREWIEAEVRTPTDEGDDTQITYWRGQMAKAVEGYESGVYTA